MKWQGKRVLVTGAGGFIGSHLTEKLLEVGARTRALVHYRADGSWGWLDDLPHKDGLEVVAGDICDRDSVRHAMRDIETVFHLAALIAIPYSYHAPLSYVRTNIEGTLNILQTARDFGVAHVVHTSTSEVYGSARAVPISEAHALQGQSPYAATKIGADKLVEAFHLSYGLPVVTVRPFNTFGPRQSARAIIPTIIAQCLNGKHVRLGNLHPTRDLSYVTNTVGGFLLAGSAPNALGRTINLGTGREISIGKLAEMIGRLVDREIIIESDTQRVRPGHSEVERLLADSSLARTVLGWKPAVDLEEGLARTIEWMRRHMEKYRPDVYAI
nr:GDP-mannose 4,6-dehydratase [Nitrospirota bacterium]